MVRKILKIVLAALISFVVFIVVVLIVDVIAGKILGTTKFADGTEKLKGGGATTATLLTISCVVTVVFAVWFYKFLTRYKISKVNEVKNVGD
jgi:hypothetical protein